MFGAGGSSIVHAIQVTPEFNRVLAIPRRLWAAGDADSLTEKLTNLLKTPQGTMSLRPIQAIALMEATQMNGLFASIRVGGGKTLISVLASYCIDAKRPLLLVPAKLKEKTRREMQALAYHWKLPGFIRIESYELLGRVQAAELFDKYKPDLIIADEGHRAKNRKAAITRRLLRYLDSNDCKFIVMSGTVTARSLKDSAHLIQRCLKQAPVPSSVTELEEWADALDEIPRGGNRVGTGALVLLCNADEAEIHKTDPLTACRRAYRRRLIETEGVVGTTEVHTGSSLSIEAIEPEMNLTTDQAFVKLRKDWELPDGHPFADGLSVYRHARELALGFYYLWDPAAPKEWLARRKKWCSACRYLLGSNQRNLDSELQITNAVAAGLYPEKMAVYQAWKEIQDTFEPKTIPVWIDDSALKAAVQWSKGGPGIIWTEHSAFAKELSRISGLPYFGKKGVDATGRPIESARADEVVIASIASNGEGRNLQAWNRNLITSLPANGAAMEQLLGRTHREGQEADEVTVEYFVTCREHAAALTQAQADGLYIEHSTGQAQKLLYADVITHRNMRLR